MAVKLRLMRMGKKKQPTYRVVASDSRSPRDGRFIEILGTYAPRSEPSGIQINNPKVVGWLSKGAQPTDTVRKLLVISGAWDEFSAAKAQARAQVVSAKPASTPSPASSAKAGTKAAAKSTMPVAKKAKAPAAKAPVAKAPKEKVPAAKAPVEDSLVGEVTSDIESSMEPAGDES